ncbi:hypothetical protein SSS_05376 [Sarcoptes scabiei]|nr:hypothetical protein SSS_05376 [Sarcoptes scabiei]
MAAQSPAIKKKFLKKFNQNKNGFGTPMLQRDKQQQELIKQSLKKSASTRKKNESHIKSLGAAIKKKLLSTPNPDKTKLTPKSTPKTPDLKNTINSSVPIDEEFAAKHRVVINELKKLDKISPERSKFGSRIPVAIISPVRSSENLKKEKQRTSTPFCSKSNSMISSVRIPRKNSSDRMNTIVENDDGNFVSKIPTIKSLPNTLHQIQENHPQTEIKRKRVKYLASKYEELIQSESSQRSTSFFKNRSSVLSVSNKINTKENSSSELRIDSPDNYVSLTSIYTKKPFEKTAKTNLDSMKHSNHSQRSESMRVISNRTYRYKEKHTCL